MRFWDTSALVPLLTAERATEAIATSFRSDPDVIVWWATRLECLSALTRLERERRIEGADLEVCIRRLRALSAGWHEIEPGDRIRDTAERLLRVHPLRAADALQLSAAIAASEEQPSSLPFVTLDERLADAAGREGFPVDRPTA